jgi:CheY-like chemotaxis protein
MNFCLESISMNPSVRKARQRAVILCVDDNPEVLECLKAFLEAFGYTVLAASSGSEGLGLASIHAIDVVIVDYFMPEMNGDEFAIQMRRLRPRAPIIMLSGTADVPMEVLKQVDAFVAKDCLSTQLLSVIAQLHERESVSLGRLTQDSRPQGFN